MGNLNAMKAQRGKRECGNHLTGNMGYLGRCSPLHSIKCPIFGYYLEASLCGPPRLKEMTSISTTQDEMIKKNQTNDLAKYLRICENCI